VDDWKYEPAHDQGLPPGQRLQSVHREAGLVMWTTRHAWWAILRGYFGLCQHVTVEGRQHLPAELPFVLVANHQSHLDALVIAWALPLKLRERVFPIAAGDTFFKTPTARIFAAAAMNALPLWRKNAGHHALEQLRQRLVDEPCGYILFPEGTRSRTGEMGPFQAGIGMLVAGTGVPVVPCHIRGTFELMPPDRKWPRRGRIGLRMGEAMVFAGVDNCRQGWVAVARELEARVRALAT
jgi:1-acyl-sn-glycerol-3-phosphate acyltransferase